MNFSMEMLLTQLANFWLDNDWDFSKKKSLLALSGGQDSMLMAELFLSQGFEFEVAHANFQLRGADSEADARFVEDWCLKNNVPYHSRKFDLTQSRSTNTQLAAREARYKWFEEVRLANHCDYLGTAHHLQDSLETFLINFGRGAGTKGLSGIPAARGKIIRPLNCLSPNEIKFLVQEKKVQWREDSSNAETKYLRNKIRHNILPELENIFPKFYEKSKDSLHFLRQDYALLLSLINQYKKQLISEEGLLSKVQLEIILEHPQRENLLFHILRDWEFNASQIRQIWQGYTHSDGAQFFTPKAKAAIREGQLFIDPNPLEENLVIQINEGENAVELPSGNLALSMVSRPEQFTADASTVYLDYAKIKWPLEVRLWQKGDYFKPLGMEGKKQKLQDFFSNNKYSIVEKKRQLLLVSDEKIAWIINARIAHDFSLTDQTTNCLKLSWQQH